MYILGIDTATNSGGAAISRNSEVIGTAMLKTPLEYSDRLIDYVDFLLRHLKLRLDEIDCFAVTTGPGSFTGLRIGISAVKAFSQALDRPAVGVSTLESLAYRFRWAGSRLAPMIDARRQQIYGALFEVQQRDIRGLSPVQVSPPARWLRELPQENCVFIGDGAQLYSRTVESVRPGCRLLRTDNSVLSALCQLAYWRFTRGETTTGAELALNYVRPSDAEAGSETP